MFEIIHMTSAWTVSCIALFQTTLRQLYKRSLTTSILLGNRIHCLGCHCHETINKNENMIITECLLGLLCVNKFPVREIQTSSCLGMQIALRRLLYTTAEYESATKIRNKPHVRKRRLAYILRCGNYIKRRNERRT